MNGQSIAYFHFYISFKCLFEKLTNLEYCYRTSLNWITARLKRKEILVGHSMKILSMGGGFRILKMRLEIILKFSHKIHL